MSGFTQQAFEKKLNDLNSSQQSIQTLSLWLIHHRKHYKTIVQTWFQGLKKVKPAKRLTYMYLANDVIQNSRKKGPEFSKEFLTILLKSFEHISNEIESSTLSSLERLLKIWEERNIYDRNHILSFRKALNTHGKSNSNQNNNNENIHNDNSSTNNNNNHDNKNDSKSLKRTNEDANLYNTSDNNHNNSHQTMGTNNANKKFSPDIQIDSELMNNMMTKIGAKIAAEYPIDMDKYENVEPENLIKILKELENSASADKDMRQKIASMPSELFDVKLFEKVLKQTADNNNGQQQQTENWIKLVNDAQNILTVYNSRLAKELEGRKQLSAMLVYFIEGQKRALNEAERNYKQYHDKLKKVMSVREELQSHLQNLPDLSQLQSVQPLPSAIDLFKKEKPD